MGGAVSSGRDNDDLIDKLLEAGYIKTPLVERVFRAVDRAEYFLAESRSTAYKDLAWKSGNLHISAPCIYSEVMEGLNLAPGLSFLNLGSGTGYLSTMVGLVLGIYGINHGIEIHNDAIEYAIRKLDEFKKHSGALDEFDFCEPKFIQGNGLCLTSDWTALYDRIYCGAACPEVYESYMKNLLKVGGVLVMPVDDQLLQIKRVSESEWKSSTLLRVSFASLVMPRDELQDFVKPIETEPLSLQILCRSLVRNLLRKNIEKKKPELQCPTQPKSSKKKRTLKKMVVPLFDDIDSSDEEDRNEQRSGRPQVGGERNRGQAMFRGAEGIFSLFLDFGYQLELGRSDRSNPNNNNINDHPKIPRDQETVSSVSESASNTGETHQVQAVIEHHENSDNNADNEEESSDDKIRVQVSGLMSDLSKQSTNENSELRTDNMEGQENETETNKLSEATVNPSTTKAGTSSSKKHNSNKREKSDSGLGDEIVEAQDSSDDEDMKLDAISSGDDEDYTSEKRYKRDSSSDSEEEEQKPIDNEMRMHESPYTGHMRDAIQKLPLPSILKRYLDYYRDLYIRKQE